MYKRQLLRGECEAFRQRGAKLSGLDVYISSNVPKGSGVSSSAAFEVLVGVILNDCFMAEKVSPIAIAQIGQWAENVYFGKPCGLMDQMASSVGNIITIDFADKANPDVEPVQVDFSKAGLAPVSYTHLDVYKRQLPAGEKCLHEQIAHLDARQCGIHNHFCFLLSWFYPRWTVYGIRLCKSTVYL